ncbi:MAG: radical SAM protein [Mobilitalea sp.]
MTAPFHLEHYLSTGVENIVKNAIKATLSNPKESLFLTKYSLASKRARNLRRQSELQGEHIPPFLIASITTQCNLKCAGCYARSTHDCHDDQSEHQLSAAEWSRIFEEAKQLGVSFILLAGGEPLMRLDVVQAAAQVPDILFPIFTNGTMLNKDYFALLSDHRNLLPILSIEGNEATTDQRRGQGIYHQLITKMDQLLKEKIVYGASITITKANILEVTSRDFLDKLYKRGCKVIFYVEYVPLDSTTAALAPDESDRNFLNLQLLDLRKSYEDMLFISFPGDEKDSGGCLAAGRGFFHINSSGSAEPCPFSPYSDTNIKNGSLREALKSPLFQKLQANESLLGEHSGGCILFEKREMVQELLG